MKKPSAWLSAIPLITLIVLLSITISIFGSDALAGPSQIVLLCSTAVCVCLGMGICKVKWRAIEQNIETKVRETTVSIYILLVIGMLSASWMISGIVPTLICYGIQIIHPAVFLASACAISAVVSVMTGSSWTTIATIGIALLGIGRALGFDDGWTAGAIISGAYFGDKVSPLSDTTVLASSVSGTPLFKHIRYMMLTTTPTILITLVTFLSAGLWMGSITHSDTTQYTIALEKTFTITPWLLTVPAATAWLIYQKVPSLIVLFASSMMAVVMMLIFQRDVLLQISGSLFQSVIITLSQSTSVTTGVPVLDKLVSTSGMTGMLNTIWLILSAMVFGGAMSACGMLKSFLHAVFRHMVKTRVGLVTATVLNGIAMNIMTGDQYISIILSANMFKEEYARQGYEPRLLSRSCEDSATVVSVLIPWNTCGMTQSTILGVATIIYLPYCFFCYLSPLMSILHAVTGWKIIRDVRKVPLTNT
ncbi:MAG: sodium:proton antiporter [Bacteroidales bacterium]|nr:sodium:proton antiporter [Bacteroidales bacterium]MCM1148343.1 sodium:proton antiporter [Bacteroidales bacterium]MCM1206964.1 sodium:proton antiporter [Bacillota bacterium]MCM1511260.1 sodium:proton antiporter [Clostridium sp.]